MILTLILMFSLMFTLMLTLIVKFQQCESHLHLYSFFTSNSTFQLQIRLSESMHYLNHCQTDFTLQIGRFIL